MSVCACIHSVVITLTMVNYSFALSLSFQAVARHIDGQASSVEKERSRLELDLEEGSRRLAMAHNEIRRLTDELESAHLTQRAFGKKILISYLLK